MIIWSHFAPELTFKVFNMQNKSVCVACVNLNLLKISFFMQDLCNPIHFLTSSLLKKLDYILYRSS